MEVEEEEDEADAKDDLGVNGCFEAEVGVVTGVFEGVVAGVFEGVVAGVFEGKEALSFPVIPLGGFVTFEEADRGRIVKDLVGEAGNDLDEETFIA